MNGLTSRPVRRATFPKSSHKLKNTPFLLPAKNILGIGYVNRLGMLDTARAIEKLGAIGSARRFIQRVGQILRYGMDAGYNQYDVTVGLIRAIARPFERHRSYLQDKKRIGQILRAIDAYGGYPQTGAAFSLAPLLMVRPGELVKGKMAGNRLGCQRMAYPGRIHEDEAQAYCAIMQAGSCGSGGVETLYR